MLIVRTLSEEEPVLDFLKQSFSLVLSWLIARLELVGQNTRSCYNSFVE